MSKHLITCPHCGERYDPLAAAQGEALGEYLSVLEGFGRYKSLIRDYIALFRKSPSGTMRVSTQLRIARELERLWRTGRFAYNGQEYQVGREAIVEALHQTVRQKGFAAGFSNHNYLKKILLTPARREAARHEQRVEEARRSGKHRRTKSATPAAVSPKAAPDETPDGDRPIWEGSPEEVIVNLAAAYRRPMIMSVLGETVSRMEEALAAAGVDLDRLRELALALPDDFHQQPGRCRELLAKCRRGAGTEVATDTAPKSSSAKDADEDWQLEMTAVRYARLVRCSNLPDREAGMAELEPALAAAGIDPARLREMAMALPKDAFGADELGRHLLERCRRRDSAGPVPLRECLPRMEE